MKEILDYKYFGNTVQAYAVALATIIIGIIIVRIFKNIVLKRLEKWSEKTKTNIDDYIVKAIEKFVVPLLYYGAIYVGITTLSLPAKVLHWLDVLSTVLVAYFSIVLITSSVRIGINSYLDKKGGGEEKKKQVGGIMLVFNLLIWAFGVVFLLDNLGYNVSSIIAGLGIGGVAIALAAQAVLKDFFSYFVIFFDRPFEIGDFIIVGDKMGTVEYIGIKTTRLRSLGGEQLVFSNTDLVDSRVHNYKRMQRRRVLFKLGVTYQTKADVLAEIPKIIKKIITDQENTTFDRAHFSSYGDFSLNFEIVYYILSADYNQYMDTQQAINLRIYKEFEQKGIEFAYPTQTLFLEKTDEEDSSDKLKK
jgi:small-conductance mechanosensitive channel